MFHILSQKIQEKQPKGPYNLAGYSFGACLAMEISLQLQGQGHKVEQLILFDGSHSYASAHIQKFKGKLAPGSQTAAETESMCAFLHQFITIDYSKVSYYCSFIMIIGLEV
jgi:fatty acid synthase